MNRLEARTAIAEASRKRTKKMIFGDRVTNVCAGEGNPHRHAYFVRAKRKAVQCTDKNGEFWEVCHTVIYPGHLPYEECEELYAPIWDSDFGGGK